MRTIFREGDDASMLVDLARLFVVDDDGRTLMGDERRSELRQWLAGVIGIDPECVSLRSDMFRWMPDQPGIVVDDGILVAIKRPGTSQFALFVPIGQGGPRIGLAGAQHTWLGSIQLPEMELVELPMAAVDALLARWSTLGDRALSGYRLSSLAVAQDGSALAFALSGGTSPLSAHVFELDLRQTDGTYRWSGRGCQYHERGTRFEWATSPSGRALASYDPRKDVRAFCAWSEYGARYDLSRVRLRPA